MTKTRVVFLAAAALLLGGCGDDKPYTGSGQSVSRAAPAPPAVALPPATPSPSSDPLLSGSEAVPTDDPLLPHRTPAQADPLAGSDPLQGRAMPTEHSHWLRGRVQEARLLVLLNGVRQGEYAGFVDQDITMKLRRGVNTVSFVYTPHQTDSSAQMDLLESEHDPPIAPLASFQSLPQPDDAAEMTPTTQRFTFVAK